MAARSSVDLTELMGLMGKLSFASIFYPLGRQWLAAPWRAARARYRRADGMVPMTQSARKALLRWGTELDPMGTTDHVGVPLASVSLFPAASSDEALCIYADASRDSSDLCGFAAWTVVDDVLLYIDGTWDVAERENLLICDLELAASTFGLMALHPLAPKPYVYSFTDNTVAMAAMRGCTPSTPAMQLLAIERSSWLLDRGVAEATERITSKANLWADQGSRSRVPLMISQAEALGLRHRRVEVPPELRQMTRDAAVSMGRDRLEGIV